MKKLLLLIVLCFLGYACSVQKLDPKFHKYSDDVEFKVTSFQSTKVSDGAASERTTYIGTGGRFKMAVIKFQNNSDEDQTINFEDLYLLDDQGKKYNVKTVIQSMKVASTNENMEHKLKAGKTKTFMVEFWPLFPKDQEVKRMIVKDREIQL